MIRPRTTTFGFGLLALVALVGEEVQLDIAHRDDLLAIVSGALTVAHDVAGTKADDEHEEILLSVGDNGILLRHRECVEVRAWPVGMITFDLGEIVVTIRRVGGAE